MKWFVTDAQLAAMRMQVGNQVWELARSDADRVRRQYDAEIQRVREDRAAELARVADPSAAYVEHLRAEVAFWRLQFAHERQRAEVSIDQRLHEQHKGPVTLPLREEGPPTGPVQHDLLDELMKNAEFAAMGSAAGVPE